VKIALFWNQAQPLVSATVRHDLYVDALGRLGHDVTTVCLAAGADRIRGRVVTFDDPDEPRHAAFWSRLPTDVLLVVTWLQMAEELEAARAAGARVVALADSDGHVGFGVHRRPVLYRSVMQHPRWRDRVAAAKYFGQRLLDRREEAARILRSIEASDVVLFNTEAAARNVQRFLTEEGRPEWAARIGVCPYPVDPSFVTTPVADARVPRLLAVGRWDSMQKDAPLLRDALADYYERGGTAEAHIFGEGTDVFASLAARVDRLSLRGVASPQALADTMRTARSLLVSSRWESGPIVAFEALCQGCTLVGTDLPNLRELVADGAFGTVVARRRPSDFAAAIATEMGRWRDGRRRPAAIAAAWRPVFSADAVVRRALASLDASADAGLRASVLAPA
jgi:glycosyltransferase involved in cell wall biosynthesis